MESDAVNIHIFIISKYIDILKYRVTNRLIIIIYKIYSCQKSVVISKKERKKEIVAHKFRIRDGSGKL